MIKVVKVVYVLVISLILISSTVAYGDEDSNKNILKQGLLGAGTGAIAAGASGGKAGQGALIGAGTAVIGGALLDAITTPSSSSSARRSAPPQDEDYYTDEDGEYYVEEAPPQESSTNKVLKQGLIGAGTGALAAGASGGKAGQGALIGAGTAVIGGALLDAITTPSQSKTRKVYRKAPSSTNTQVQQENTTSDGTRKKIVRKYDESGKVVSEEEIYY